VGFLFLPQRKTEAFKVTPTQESKAQRVERLKREKNPWESLHEIRRFAREGYGSIPPEWLGTYFRWWGIYTQGDGAGAVGGKGGEGKSVPCFMVRIRVPNGILTAGQLRAVSQVARLHARGLVDLTVRQNVQLHWVSIESLPDVLETLWRAGLTTKGSCGDDTRNITGCPLAGLDRDELCDASPLVHKATELLVGNPDFYNLPRKFKICITGCRAWCSYPEINDIGLTAAARTSNGHPEIGFTLHVGGGLSSEPFFARRLNAFVRWNQVLPVIKGVAEIFRDADCLRENRERARLKYLFMRHGWTAESFQDELERRIGFHLEPGTDDKPPADAYRDHVGVHSQKQEGYSYVGAAVLRGRITAEQLLAAADLAERFARGELRITNMQNLLVVNVPTERAPDLARELDAVGLHPGGSPFGRGVIACTGTEFCKLAVTETKTFARWLVEELDELLPDFDQDLKLHITGCPNSCGQHWIADIGIEGKKMKVDGRFVDAYYFFVGGSVGEHQSFARPVGFRCPASEVPAAIARLLRAYQAERRNSENLRQFFARHREDILRYMLAGEELAAVSRDPSPGRPPHGVEG
jgi:sulfite reductase (ferredoxin)